MLHSLPNARFLAQTLQAAEERQAVCSQNIANVNTPGYQRQELSFAATLEQRLQDPLPNAPAVVQTDHTPSARRDGNNVQIDREIGLLSKNALLYEACAELLTTELSGWRRAIRMR